MAIRPQSRAFSVVALLVAAVSASAYGARIDISAEEARNLIVSGQVTTVVDVREQSEYDAGHIDGAILMPYNSGVLQARHGELPVGPMIVYCQSGGRSRAASDFLDANGHTGVHNMLGGYPAWVALPPLPTPTPTPTPSPTASATPTPTPSPEPGVAILTQFLLRIITNPLGLDQNGDGRIDIADIVALRARRPAKGVNPR